MPRWRPTRPAAPAGSGGRHAGPESAGGTAPGPVEPAEGTAQPAGAAEPTEVAEETGGKTKSRRGLFRRNRTKPTEPAEVERESAALPDQDEEFVDWVAGLASDDNADDARSLRTGRHHRD